MLQRLIKFLLRGAFLVSSTRLGGWFFTTVQPPIDRFLLKRSEGRYSVAGIAIPTLLLTTTGRNSGKQRTAPLLYLPSEDGSTYYVIGSRGGRRAHAGWFYNIQANSEVAVTVGGETLPYTATVLTDPQRTRIWQHFVDYNHHFDRYQARIDREIPVIRLQPASPEGRT